LFEIALTSFSHSSTVAQISLKKPSANKPSDNSPSKIPANAQTGGARTNVTLRENLDHTERGTACYIIVIGEVRFGGVKARLFVLCAYDSFNHSGRPETLGRLGPGRGQQRHHLFHRLKNIAMGFHSGKFVLYRAVCAEPPGMAQGGDFLTGGRLTERLLDFREPIRPL
jgi:hypothetical protein